MALPLTRRRLRNSLSELACEMNPFRALCSCEPTTIYWIRHRGRYGRRFFAHEHRAWGPGRQGRELAYRLPRTTLV